MAIADESVPSLRGLEKDLESSLIYNLRFTHTFLIAQVQLYLYVCMWSNAKAQSNFIYRWTALCSALKPRSRTTRCSQMCHRLVWTLQIWRHTSHWSWRFMRLVLKVAWFFLLFMFLLVLRPDDLFLASSSWCARWISPATLHACVPASRPGSQQYSQPSTLQEGSTTMGFEWHLLKNMMHVFLMSMGGKGCGLNIHAQTYISHVH